MGHFRGNSSMNACVRLATIAVAAGTLTALGTPAMALPKPTVYANCTALHRVYPHGVGKSGAHDKTTGKPVTTFTRYLKTYQLNASRLDRDHDGIACEKR